MQTVISSRENPYIKQLVRLLSQKKERDASGCFALEGARLCMDAMHSGFVPRQLFLTPQAAKKYTQVAALAPKAEQVLWLDESLAARIADTKTPQGVFAICEKPPVQAIELRGDGRYLLLDSVRDPGNVGAILRTAEALGVNGVFASADCADFFSPKVLRAAMGAVFRLCTSACGDMVQQVHTLRGQGVRVYAAALTPDAVPVQTLELSGACAMAIGNEGDGLKKAVIDACDSAVLIPMSGGAESLNAAVAAGILLWELCGPRARGGADA